MEWLFRPTAVMALSGAMLLPPPAIADTPTPALADLLQLTSTQVVTFALDGSFCPQHGLYGIAHVSVDGTSGMTADQNFIWTTQEAATSIHSVPRQGATANVTIVYHCNVQVLWWLEPGAAHKVTTALWVNGSGEQPSYIIRPGGGTQPTTPPTAPSQAPQPTPTETTQPALPPAPPSQTAQPAPTQTTQPAPSQTTQPALPPAPSQAPEPTPSHTAQPAPTQTTQPTPTETPEPTLPPTPPQTAQPTPSQSAEPTAPQPPQAAEPTAPQPPQAAEPPPMQTAEPTPTPTPTATAEPTTPPILLPTP